MRVEALAQIIGADFYTGVPDSQLRALCDYLTDTYGSDPQHHIIAANEGSCAALAAGYHLATGKVPAVYLQNSGEGNLLNPAASLLHEQVYAIPMVFLIGWRGEPGVPDEPQHRYQGQITLKLLEDLGIPYFVLGRDTTEAEACAAMDAFRPLLTAGRDVAFVVRKGALTYDRAVCYTNQNRMRREEILRHILAVSGADPVVCTTGKASRELFELREAAGQGHECDFLTVGSMGHCSSIALGIALQKPDARVWCLDGDGAALMHLGALAVIGASAPANLIHVVINNGAHETVGGMPTAAGKIDLAAVARGCGYTYAACADDLDALDRELAAAGQRGALTFLDVRCAIGARADLGRPTTGPQENKRQFMEHLRHGRFAGPDRRSPQR